jgi:hypothetical protein
VTYISCAGDIVIPSDYDPSEWLLKCNADVYGLRTVYCKSEEIAKSLFKAISTNLEFTNLAEGVASLGLSIEGVEDTFKVTMDSYIELMATKFGLTDAKTAPMPLPTGFSYSEATKKQIAKASSAPYRQLLGSLIYAQQCMFPQLSYAVSILAHYQDSKWGPSHWKALKHALRYATGQISKPLILSANPTGSIEITLITDASFKNPFESGAKSRSGCLAFVGNSLVWWCSRMQSRCATSSTQAEVYALEEGVKEVAFVKDLLNELSDMKIIITAYCDSQSAIKPTISGALTDRNKHYRTSLGYLKDFIDEHQVSLKYCPTELMLADSLTKITPVPVFNRHMSYLNDLQQWIKDVDSYKRPESRKRSGSKLSSKSKCSKT